MTKKTTRLKRLILADEILLIPLVHDALCAKIAEAENFQAIFASGYCNSAALLGAADLSLLTLTEMADCASRLVDAVDLPVFADADTGYGDVPNVVRTMRLFEKAGVAALFLEDQEFPKRCGHMAGKQVIPTDQMIDKIKAALDTRRDGDLMLMARTDALAIDGIDAALERAARYAEAGADLVFVEAPQNLEQLARIPREVRLPTMANMIPGGKTPILSAPELQKLGYALVATMGCSYVIAKAVREFFRRLHQAQTPAGMDDLMVDFAQFNALVGKDRIA
jgi:methylisocitrate lyase